MKSRASAAFLDALPVAPQLTLANADFVSGVRHHLGLRYVPAGVGSAVRCHDSCGAIIQPNDCDHAMVCTVAKRKLLTRHNLLSSAWRQIAQRATVHTNEEPAVAAFEGGAEGMDGGLDGKRADITFTLGHRLALGDVSVIHPGASAVGQHGTWHHPGAAAEHRDEEKREKYATAAIEGYDFYPLSVETYGWMGKPALALLDEIAEVAAASGTVSKGLFKAMAIKQLSVALVKGNAMMYRACLSAFVEGSGRAPMYGDDLPSAEVSDS